MNRGFLPGENSPFFINGFKEKARELHEKRAAEKRVRREIKRFKQKLKGEPQCH